MTNSERPIPLGERKGDLLVLIFFWINILFVTYLVDIEQLTLPDLRGDWQYPLWPPEPVVKLIHWYGNNFDPLLMARPMWWRMTMWIDSLLYGPFYLVAIYAWTRGKNWIRMPSIFYSITMLTQLVIMTGEQLGGEFASPRPEIALGVTLPWWICSLYILRRMVPSASPFTEAAPN